MANMIMAVMTTLGLEGGFQDDPKDHANWSCGRIGVGTLIGTKYGITAIDMPGINIASLTFEQALQWYLTTIKPERYNNPLYTQINSQTIASKLFDMGVLFGISAAVECLQRCLDLPPDGIFGPITLAKCNAANAALLISEYRGCLSERARKIASGNPNEAHDLAGWLTRIAS